MEYVHFQDFKTKYFLVKIGLHNALDKKRLGKIEMFLSFMDLNLNLFNIFIQEFIVTENNEEKDDGLNSDSSLKSNIITPELVRKY